MKRTWIRSTIFNLAFYGITAVLSIAYLPALILPRSWYVGLVKLWLYIVTFLEYVILGLRYEVRGAEHIPEDGSYLIAAKHQSPYETLKLRLLFKDPAIILKKELLAIPVWGYHLRKSGVIAIDRSTPEKALKSIEEGALRIQEQGRPIVIFPQGTRVWPDEKPSDKPYKAGIARVQEATKLPIIPMATNSGLFWPRSGWLKSPGTIVFQFLKPIKPDKDRKKLMKEIEKKLEEESNSLMNEARITALDKKSHWLIALVAILLIGFGFYSYAWVETARAVKQYYTKSIAEISPMGKAQELKVSGFPGPINFDVAEELIKTTKTSSMKVEDLHVEIWPVPFVPIKMRTGPISLRSFKWENALVLDNAKANLGFSNNILYIYQGQIKQGDFTIWVRGAIDLKQKPIPLFDLAIVLENHHEFFETALEQGVINVQTAMFVSTGLTALKDEDGLVRIPLVQRGLNLYAGPIPVVSLDAFSPEELGSPPAPDQ